jgi:AcrR family transcriptional regulator
MEATVEIVAEQGSAGFTMDAVARRAKVTKSTVYRYWPSKGALMIDAYLSIDQRDHKINTGFLMKDLELALKEDFMAVKDPRFARLGVAILLESQIDPELAALMREKTILGLRQKRKEMLQRGIVRGEISPAANLEVVLDMELGAMWYRTLSGFVPLDVAYPERLAAQLSKGLRVTARPRS